ncbi:MAG: hypothetical protein IK151_02985 [Erysipelotrichaceae bacterium]|nr:hypothetical protein [Erysipelotrichaceae bacterium]
MITIARILLRHTDISVIFADERISRFLELSERLMISKEEPDKNDPSLLRVIDSFYMAPLFMIIIRSIRSTVSIMSFSFSGSAICL